MGISNLFISGGAPPCVFAKKGDCPEMAIALGKMMGHWGYPGYPIFIRQTHLKLPLKQNDNMGNHSLE